MPSYAAAAKERPVTVSGEQPPRQLAQRKNAPGAGRPPNPLCCGKSTKRISTGSSIVRCEICEKTYGPDNPPPPQSVKPAAKPAEVFGPHCPSCATLTRERDGKWWCKWCEIELPQTAAAETPAKPAAAAEVSAEGRCVSQKAPSVARKAPEVSPAPSPFATGRRGPKPLPVLGAGLGEKETKRLQEDLGATRSAYVTCCTAGCAEPAHYKPFEGRFYCPQHRNVAVDNSCATVVTESPGLNGDHATRAAERAKIPPSRPANNSRGEPAVPKTTFKVCKTPPPNPYMQGVTDSIAAAILQLPADGSEHLEFPTDAKTAQRIRDAVHRVRTRNRIDDVEYYLAGDRSCRVVIRRAKVVRP